MCEVDFSRLAFNVTQRIAFAFEWVDRETGVVYDGHEYQAWLNDAAMMVSGARAVLPDEYVARLSLVKAAIEQLAQAGEGYHA